MAMELFSMSNFLFFCRVALIGGHTIFKIDDTDIIPIANDQDFARMNNNPDEAKYVCLLIH